MSGTRYDVLYYSDSDSEHDRSVTDGRGHARHVHWPTSVVTSVHYIPVVRTVKLDG